MQNRKVEKTHQHHVDQVNILSAVVLHLRFVLHKTYYMSSLPKCSDFEISDLNTSHWRLDCPRCTDDITEMKLAIHYYLYRNERRCF